MPHDASSMRRSWRSISSINWTLRGDPPLLLLLLCWCRSIHCAQPCQRLFQDLVVCGGGGGVETGETASCSAETELAGGSPFLRQCRHRRSPCNVLLEAVFGVLPFDLTGESVVCVEFCHAGEVFVHEGDGNGHRRFDHRKWCRNQNRLNRILLLLMLRGVDVGIIWRPGSVLLRARRGVRSRTNIANGELLKKERSCEAHLYGFCGLQLVEEV